jgi:sulfur carrier protein ThiS
MENDCVTATAEPGMNLMEIIGGPREQLHVAVNDVAVPMEAWESTYPQSGDIVTLAVRPAGIETIIASIWAAVASSTLTAGATAAATSAVIGVTGSTVVGMVAGIAAGVMSVVSPLLSIAMGIMSLVSPQRGQRYEQGSGSTPFFSLTGGSNSSDQWGYVPKLYGRMRFLPPLGGDYYTHTLDGEQYLHVLLCLGYGPLDIGGTIVGEPETIVGQGTTAARILGQQFLTSRMPSHRLGIIDNIKVGNAYLSDLTDNWDAPPKTAAVRYQIGTVAALMNPERFNDTAIYTQDMEESSLDLKLNTGAELGYTDADNHWVTENMVAQTQFTPEGTIYCTFDIQSPAFYVMAGDKEVREYHTGAILQVRYRRTTGNTAWQTPTLEKNTLGYTGDSTIPGPGQHANWWHIIAKSRSPFRRTNGFQLMFFENDTWKDKLGPIPANTQFEIEIKRVWSLKIKRTVSVMNDLTWVTARYFLPSAAWNTSVYHNTNNIILLALQIKATNRISGSLPPVSIEAESVLGRAWTSQYNADPNQRWGASSNPADIYLDIVRGPHLQAASRLPDSAIDWHALEQWRAFCADEDGDEDRRKYTYNYFHRDHETVLDRLRAVATTGRASWTMRNGLLSVVRDNEYLAVQAITPRNSRNFELTKGYPLVPHALRVRWVEPDNWEQTETLVLDDDYQQRIGAFWFTALGESSPTPWTVSKTNPALRPEPTLFEVLETKGVTNLHQAHREGRYYLAAMRLRRELYKVEMDIENLIATRGDCVYLTHEAMVLARASGRIKSIDNIGTVAAPIYSVSLDEPVYFDADPAVAFRLWVRCIDGSLINTVTVVALGVAHPGHASEVNAVTITSGSLEKVAIGDMFFFGRVNYECILAKITQIDYNPDLSATLSLVYAAPQLLRTDREYIDDDNFPGATPDPRPDMGYPPTPDFLACYSSPHDMYVGTDGNVYSKVVASWSIKATATTRTDYVFILYQADGADWRSLKVEATLGTGAVAGLPPNTPVLVYLLGYNESTDRYSAPTEVKSLITAGANVYMPYAPAGLVLAYENRPVTEGEQVSYILHLIAQWNIIGFSAAVEVAWDPRGNSAPQNPEEWANRRLLAAGATQFVTSVGYSATFAVAVRNQAKAQETSAALPGATGDGGTTSEGGSTSGGDTTTAASGAWSLWTKGVVAITDTAGPPPLTALSAVSLKDRITITWAYAGTQTAGGAEIWMSRFNSREGGQIGDAPELVPPARLLTKSEYPSTAYEYLAEDNGYYYFWGRAYNSQNRVSSWYPVSSTKGVYTYFGIKGDGAAPPPPYDVVLTPENWVITISWKRPSIVDLAGTVVYASKTNDRSTAFVLGITSLLTMTHMRLNLNETWYYWLKNVDVEGLESDYTTVKSATTTQTGGEYRKLFKADKLIADCIDTRGLTIRTENRTDTNPNAPLSGSTLIFGAGAVERPAWLPEHLIPKDKLDAYIRKAAILEAYVGGSVGQPGFIQNFDYNATYSDPTNNVIVPGKGWKIEKDGSAYFYNLVAKGTIYSENYRADEQGWKIDRQGNAELNSGKIRGHLIVDGTLSVDKIISGSIGRSNRYGPSDLFEATNAKRDRTFHVGWWSVDDKLAGKPCLLTAHVSMKTAMSTYYVAVYVGGRGLENRPDPGVASEALYDYGSMDSRFFSKTTAWEIIAPAAGELCSVSVDSASSANGIFGNVVVVLTVQRL